MEFCVEDRDKYGDRVVSEINAFIRNCLAHPTAVRGGTREEGVAAVLLADFASMGSLKEKVLNQTKTCIMNLMGSTLDGYALVLDPEKPRGYSQNVLSPREHAARASIETTNEADSDADRLVEEQAVLPSIEVKADVKQLSGRGERH